MWPASQPPAFRAPVLGTAAAALASAAVVMALRARARNRARARARMRFRHAVSAATGQLAHLGQLATQPVKYPGDIAAVVAAELLAMLAQRAATARALRH